jgi:hypothetical protein
MIAFLTSLRARSLAKNWDYHVWMLERVVVSMLAQSEGDVRVVVACHDVPETPLASDSRVHFLPVKFPPPERNNDDMCCDKVLKLSAGCRWAADNGADYVVFNDADDLVSSRIGSLVAANPGANGWYATSEYFYTYGGRMARFFQLQGMSAGPCVVIRGDLLTFASPPFAGDWTSIVLKGGESDYLRFLGRHGEPVNILAAVGLGNYREFTTQEGYPLQPMPFPTNVVINHLESTSHVAGGIGSYHHGSAKYPAWRILLSRVKQRIKWLPTLRYMTRTIRREFSIPLDSEIPEAYRGGGSIFWR